MTSDGTAKWVPARRAAQSPLRVGSKRFCRIISSLHPEKTGEKRFYYKQDRFALTGFLSKTENRVGGLFLLWLINRRKRKFVKRKTQKCRALA